MSSFAHLADDGLTWQLLYTKPRAEAWVDANLRRQGFVTLLPRVLKRSSTAPLFPRYVFAGYTLSQRAEPFAGTYGVRYVVHCGARPARVPRDVIVSIVGRMDDRGIVRAESLDAGETLFAAHARQRVTILAKFAEAGFRVRAA